MATYTTPIQESYPTVGSPLTWAKEIHDGLLAVGLTQTSDTGQMSMTSLPLVVATASTSYGYTIYQWTDAYQSTFPIYMKLEWRNNLSSQTWNIFATLGSGTNGSGTLTGAYFTDTITSSSSSASGTRTQSYICYKDGGLFIALSPLSTQPYSTKIVISFSRLIDVNTGNPLPGVWGLKNSSTTGNPVEKIYAPLRATQAAASGGSSTALGSMAMNRSAYYVQPTDSDVIVSGGNTYTPVYQSLVMVPQLVTCNAWVAPYSTIVGDFTWQRWGQTHTYKAFPNSTWYYGPDGGSTKMNFAMRWE